MNLILAVISGDAFVNALIWLVIVALVYGVAIWALNEIKPAEPVGKIIRVILVLGVALVVINVLLRLAGHPIF